MDLLKNKGGKNIMRKVRKHDYVVNALRNGTVYKESCYAFPRTYDENDRMSLSTEKVKVYMVIAPNKGINSQEDRDYIEKIEVFYNDKDNIKLITERDKKGVPVDYTFMNSGAYCILVTKNFKGLFTSKKVMNCIMALNAAKAYYTMNTIGRNNMAQAAINVKVCKFLVCQMKFKPNVIKAALELCAKRDIESMFKYCKVLYKSSKKGRSYDDYYDDFDIDIDANDYEDEIYPDEENPRKNESGVKDTESSDGKNSEPKS